MAEDTGAITEDVVLKLKTNFEAELTRAANQYSSFQKKTATTSQSIESSVNSMYRQVSTNLSSMMGGVQKTVLTAIQLTRNGMRGIQGDAVTLSKTYEAYVNKMLGLKNQVRGVASSPDLTPLGKQKILSSAQNQMREENIKTAQEMYRQLGELSEKSSSKIVKSVNDSLNGVKKLVAGTKVALMDLSIDSQNIDPTKSGAVGSVFKSKENLDAIEKQMKVAQNSLKEQGKRVLDAEKQMQQARLAMNSQTYVKLEEAQKRYDDLMLDKAKLNQEKKKIPIKMNMEIKGAREELVKQMEIADKLKAKQEAYFQATVSNNTKAQQAYKQTEKTVNDLINTFEKAKGKITGTLNKQIQEIFSSTAGKSGEAKGIFDGIKAHFDDLRQRYEKLSNTHFIGKKAVSDFKADVDIMKKAVENYNSRINELKNDIANLQKLHNKGLAPNAGPAIKQRQEELNQLQKNVKEVTRMSNRASSELETLSKKQSKSLFSVGWESVRNFRWQVAGLIYLAQRAAQLVRATFFNILQDIQDFRTSAMAIAASITFSMIGDVTTNFNKAFEYSKDLMLKMEMEAAKTILTLEDMTMLVKTFTQAGIIPKGDEDLKKISTIGTAIKVLTEGMANAGVQMRQELYAIIQGRQRATDQVATMFKMVGVDINEVLKKSKKEGKDLIDVLSEALEPFAKVNEAMARDYGVQLEALQKVWEKIKRIGADNTYKQVSESIAEFNSKLVDAKGNLTSLGLDGSRALYMLMESMRLTIKYVNQMFAGFSENSEIMSRIIDLYEITARVLGVLAIAADYTGTAVRVLSLEIAEAFYLLREATKGPFGEFAEIREFYKGLRDEAWKNVNERSGDLSVDIMNSIKGLRNLKNAAADTGGLLDKFKISKPDSNDTLNNFENKLNSVVLQSKEGIEKINEEFRQGEEYLAEYEEAYLKTQKEIASALLREDVTPKERESLEKMYEGTEEKLTRSAKYRSALLARQKKETNDFYENQRNKIAGVTSEYERLLESMEVAPKTPLETFQKNIDKLYISLVEFGTKEKVSKDKMKILWDRFFDYQVSGAIDAYDEMDKTFNSFYESMSSHRVLSPIQAIGNEFRKLAVEIDKLKIDGSEKEKLKAWLPIFEAERVALANINLELDKQKTLVAELSSQAEVYKLSIKPSDKQKAEILDLEAQYANSAAAINAEIDSIREKWANDPNGMRSSERERIESLQRQLENLGIVFEQHKKDVQEPFWKGLKDSYEGWADGLSDVLTEAMWDLDSFHDNFSQWVEDIGKQIFKLMVKTMIVDNLSNALMSGMKQIFPAIAGAVGGAIGGSFPMDGTGQVPIGASGLTFTQNRSGAYLDYTMASGGIIGEPVIGQGLNSGKSYMFGEDGSEAVIPTNKLGGNNTPNVNVNVINQTTNEVTASKQKVKFDGKQFVVDVILEDLHKGGRLRTALGR